jgi:hypothetical protein
MLWVVRDPKLTEPSIEGLLARLVVVQRLVLRVWGRVGVLAVWVGMLRQ